MKTFGIIFTPMICMECNKIARIERIHFEERERSYSSKQVVAIRLREK